MSGFFKASTLAQSQAPTPLIPRCGECGLYKSCMSPKMPVTGSGRRGILIVAESPGTKEDAEGEQLVGESGQFLRRVLREFDVDLDRDCWKTNAVICLPQTEDGEHRPPTDAEIGYCRPNLIRTIKELQPESIILLGGPSVKSLIGWLWMPEPGSITRWVGWNIPAQRINAWVSPTYHPAYCIREGENGVTSLWFRRHIETAISLRGRPWEAIPKYAAGIECTLDSQRAAAVIRQMIGRGGNVAFDYETNRLKPDAADAEIVCCSVCWEGKKTISFPWIGEAVVAMGELIRSPLGKIASNLKFEQRWSHKFFGYGAANWKWDTMQSAHWLDNRREITSIKFQAFVRLGVEEWDSHIKQFLSETDDEGINCVSKDVDLMDLLEYCAYDSLYEYLVAVQQIEGSPCRGLLSRDSTNFTTA